MPTEHNLSERFKRLQLVMLHGVWREGRRHLEVHNCGPHYQRELHSAVVYGLQCSSPAADNPHSENNNNHPDNSQNITK